MRKRNDIYTQNLVLEARDAVAHLGVSDSELFVLLRALRKRALMDAVEDRLCQKEPNWRALIVEMDLGASGRRQLSEDPRLHSPKVNPDLYPED